MCILAGVVLGMVRPESGPGSPSALLGFTVKPVARMWTVTVDWVCRYDVRVLNEWCRPAAGQSQPPDGGPQSAEVVRASLCHELAKVAQTRISFTAIIS
jgi:hypothetical protein